MSPAWLRPLFWIALAAFAAWLLRLAGLVDPAWALLVCVLAGLLCQALWPVGRLDRWLRNPGAAPFPEGPGTWENVFARLYRHERSHSQQLSQLTHALAGFRSAAQALPDGVVTLDGHLHIEWCNGIAEQHLALRLKTDQGRSIINLVRHPEFVRYLQSAEWDEPIILRGVRGDDRTLHAQLIRYGAQHALLLTRDITQVERLETMRRDFVANVSHELRTPLTVLSGFIETLQELPAEAVSAEQRTQYLSLMHAQAARMQALVADLLTLSSLESSPVEEPQVVKMGPLIEKLRVQAQALAAGRLHIRWNVDTGLNLLGTESELTSAFSNLVTNAVRYTPDGGNVEVTWEKRGESYYFSVRDTGIGIEARHLPRLTERFYRVDRGRSRETGGTGLGLAIVKHVLLRHHAQLNVDSEFGHGSTFTCVFPAERGIAPLAQTPASPDARAQIES